MQLATALTWADYQRRTVEQRGGRYRLGEDWRRAEYRPPRIRKQQVNGSNPFGGSSASSAR